MFPESDLIPISALQHFVVCPRQCALIHLEGVWIEDQRTAEGRVAHERVDRGGAETRDAVRRAYDACAKISFDGAHYRKDIAARALKK